MNHRYTFSFWQSEWSMLWTGCKWGSYRMIEWLFLSKSFLDTWSWSWWHASEAVVNRVLLFTSVQSHFPILHKNESLYPSTGICFHANTKSSVDLKTKVSQWDLMNGRNMQQNRQGKGSSHLSLMMARMMQWHQVRLKIPRYLRTCAGTTMTVLPHETETTKSAGEALLLGLITPRGLINLLHCRFRNNHDQGQAKITYQDQNDQSTAYTQQVTYQDLKSVVSERSAKGSLCVILANSGSIQTQICRR